MNPPELFVGISGVRCDVDTFEFGDGILLRTTYAHLMAPFMIAFTRPEKPGQHHPAPWAAASGGFGFDVAVELSVPNAESLPCESTTAAWWIVALLRLRVGPTLRAPVISNHQLSNEAVSFKGLHVEPLEVTPYQVSLHPEHPEANSRISRRDLEWVRDNWSSSLKLLSESPKFGVLIESFDQAAFHARPQLALLMLWTGLEEMFSPSKTELRYRISALIASYLERPGQARLTRQKAIAKLYDSRSAAAHGRGDTKIDSLWETYSMARQVVLKVIEEKHAPSATELEERMFGVETP